MRRRLRWIAMATLGLAALATNARAGPACIVEVETEPSNPVVGQQVLYRVRIFRRADVSRVHWVHPPAFPNLRAEWLPGRAEDTRASRHGSLYLVREEQRALFPGWAGTVRLPSFEIRCEQSGERQESSVPVPSVTLDVAEPPAKGRPADFDGVIGPVQAQALAEQQEITLGESVRVSILVRGASNVWDVKPPFGSLEPRGRYEVFPMRPELDLETGERLYVRRYFRFDFVPREVGSLEIPTIEVPFYDPTRRRFGRAVTEPVRVTVRERDEPAPGRSATTTPEAEPTSESSADVLIIAVALGSLGAVGGAAGWQIGRRRRRVRLEVRRALRDARVAEERRDPAQRAAALVRGLEVVEPKAPRDSLDEIEALRGRLESIRFGTPGDVEGGGVWTEAETWISRLR